MTPPRRFAIEVVFMSGRKTYFGLSGKKIRVAQMEKWKFEGRLTVVDPGLFGDEPQKYLVTSRVDR